MKCTPLWAQGDPSLAHGRFVDKPRGADRVPLAPAVAAGGGLLVRDAGPFDASLRVRHVGSRAANEDNSVAARGYAIWEAHAAWRFSGARVVVAVDNLFNATWNEAQFATTSRLRDERTAVTELNFTPGAPRSLQVGLEFRR